MWLAPIKEENKVKRKSRRAHRRAQSRSFSPEEPVPLAYPLYRAVISAEMPTRAYALSAPTGGNQFPPCAPMASGGAWLVLLTVQFP